jgi:hypothetical protein
LSFLAVSSADGRTPLKKGQVEEAVYTPAITEPAAQEEDDLVDEFVHSPDDSLKYSVELEVVTPGEQDGPSSKTYYQGQLTAGTPDSLDNYPTTPRPSLLPVEDEPKECSALSPGKEPSWINSGEMSKEVSVDLVVQRVLKGSEGSSTEAMQTSEVVETTSPAISDCYLPSVHETFLDGSVQPKQSLNKRRSNTPTEKKTRVAVRESRRFQKPGYLSPVKKNSLTFPRKSSLKQYKCENKASDSAIETNEPSIHVVIKDTKRRSPSIDVRYQYSSDSKLAAPICCTVTSAQLLPPHQSRNLDLRSSKSGTSGQSNSDTAIMTSDVSKFTRQRLRSVNKKRSAATSCKLSECKVPYKSRSQIDSNSAGTEDSDICKI